MQIMNSFRMYTKNRLGVEYQIFMYLTMSSPFYPSHLTPSGVALSAPKGVSLGPLSCYRLSWLSFMSFNNEMNMFNVSSKENTTRCNITQPRGSISFLEGESSM